MSNTESNVVAVPNGRSGFSLAPQSLDEAMRFADVLAKSSIVPKDFQGSPGNILVAVQWGAELGLPPLQAMQSIAVINGRPAIWGDAVIGLVRGSGLLELIDEQIGTDHATCTVKRRGEEPVTRTFSMEDAKRAGLAGKQGPWQQYPKRMLQMRARAWALRDVFPDVLRGVHVGEEAQDMPEEKDMGRIEQVEKSASRAEKVREAIGKRKAEGKALQPTHKLEDVLTAISAASTIDALAACANLAAHLDNGDKERARNAYRARLGELNAKNQPEITPRALAPADDEFIELKFADFTAAISECESLDRLDELSEAAAQIAFSDAQRAKLAELVAQKMKGAAK